MQILSNTYTIPMYLSYQGIQGGIRPIVGGKSIIGTVIVGLGGQSVPSIILVAQAIVIDNVSRTATSVPKVQLSPEAATTTVPSLVVSEIMTIEDQNLDLTVGLQNTCRTEILLFDSLQETGICHTRLDMYSESC